MSMQFILFATICCLAAVANASLAPAPKKMTVPCVARSRNMEGTASYCHIMPVAETCTAWGMPTYATYKECSTDKEAASMGPVKACKDVPKDLQTSDVWPVAYKFCLDAEPTQAQKEAAKKAWAAQDAADKAAAEKKAAEEAKKAADTKAAAQAAIAKGSWVKTSGKDIVGADVACNGNSDCLYCGSIQEMKERCGELMGAGCMGFTFNTENNCGWLKKNVAAVKTAKWEDKAKWEVYFFYKY